MIAKRLLMAATVSIVVAGSLPLGQALATLPVGEAPAADPSALHPLVADDPLRPVLDAAVAGAPFAEVTDALDRYLEVAGPVPARVPIAAGPNDEVSPYAYRVWHVGDVNGDGIDELGLDGDCVDRDSCLNNQNPLTANCPGIFPKKLRVIDGKTTEDVWTMNLNLPYAIQTSLDPPADKVPGSNQLGCVRDFVVGVVPNDHGTKDFLVYHYVLNYLPTPNYYHDYFLVDAENGKILWHYTKGVPPGIPSTSDPARGVEEFGFNYQNAAKNFVLVPILQVPPDAGVRLLPERTKPGLVVRSVGWVAVGQGIQAPVIGYVGRVFAYEPVEWAAGVELATGWELWKKDTFQPQTDRSVFPLSYQVPNDVTNMVCCFDLNLDGVPDAVFATLEWFFTDLASPPGYLEGYASRIAAWDGAHGNKLWEFYGVPDSKRFLPLPGVAPLGDVDGDGGSDFVLYLSYGDLVNGKVENKETTTSIRRGTDVKELWSDKAPEPIMLAPLGDANGDGGNDLLAFRSKELNTFANFTDMEMVLRDGRTGATIWSASSTIPGLDLDAGLKNLYANGLPDFDRDGVGDVWLDAPEFLPDQTVVHHMQWISGRTASNLTGTTTVGAFLFPVASRDLNADGTEDYLIMQGDIVDLWVTAFDGTKAAPFWSRRIFTTQTSGAFRIIPNLQTFNLELDGEAGQDLFVGLSLRIQDFGGFTDKGGGSYQQFYGLHGNGGRLLWGIPEYEEGDESLIVGKGTPATQQYLRITTGSETGGVVPEPPASAAGGRVSPGGLAGLPWGIIGFSLAAAASLVGAYVIAGRKLHR